MKTILHTIDTTGPGGAETVFIDLATCLPSSSYRSVIVIRGKGWVYEELRRRGAKPMLLEAEGSFNWRYLRSLVSLIRREKVDLVQSHLLGSNVYCALAGMLARTPVVATFHGVVDIGENERLKTLKFAALRAGTDRIVAVSRSLRDNIAARSPLARCANEVIYNGIDTAAFKQAKRDQYLERFQWSPDDTIVGCLGNIRPAKAYDLLLRVAAMLPEAGPRFRFLVAGEGHGELLDKLMQLRHQLGLEDSVQFVGFVDDPAAFLGNLDIFLLTSSSEGFSIATVQAMAAGLPVIATRSGGPEEIITDGVNGLLVPPGNAEAISQALVNFTGEPRLMQDMGVRARQHAEETFGLETMLGAYEAVYRQLLDD